MTNRIRRRLAPAAVLGAAALAVAVGSATPAYAAVDILSSADSIELANTLAEAAEEQDVCYGWDIDIDDQGSSSYTSPDSEYGSNLGPGRHADNPDCQKWVQLDVQLTWTSESSESEDSASATITSNFGSFSDVDLEDYGVTEGNLLGDNDDKTIIEGVSALPLIVADKGLAPPVPVEANTKAIPASDVPTDSPGSDVIRGNVLLWFVVIVMLAAIGWLVYLFTRGRERAPSVPDTPAALGPVGGFGGPTSSPTPPPASPPATRSQASPQQQPPAQPPRQAPPQQAPPAPAPQPPPPPAQAPPQAPPQQEPPASYRPPPGGMTPPRGGPELHDPAPPRNSDQEP